MTDINKTSSTLLFITSQMKRVAKSLSLLQELSIPRSRNNRDTYHPAIFRVICWNYIFYNSEDYAIMVITSGYPRPFFRVRRIDRGSRFLQRDRPRAVANFISNYLNPVNWTIVRDFLEEKRPCSPRCWTKKLIIITCVVTFTISATRDSEQFASNILRHLGSS